MEASGTAIAIRGKDGVVFAVEKIITSKLYEKSANRRVFSVDSHVGMTGSGLYADGELNLNNNYLVINYVLTDIYVIVSSKEFKGLNNLFILCLISVKQPDNPKFTKKSKLC